MSQKNELQTKMHLVNEKVRFQASCEGRLPLHVDYAPPLGDGEGYTSLELLLIALGSCLATTVKTLLTVVYKRRVESLAVTATGRRRATHPTSFEAVNVRLRVQSPDLTEEELEEAVRRSEEELCPVVDMVRGRTGLEVVYELDPAPRSFMSA